MKKFNQHNKESKNSKEEVPSSDSNNSLLENFTKKYGLHVNNVEKTNSTVNLFEDIISKLDQYVKKDELSDFLFNQIVVLKEQFEDFKTNVNNLNQQKNQEITNDVESIISRAKLVIENVDKESSLYKKKYYEDIIDTDKKFQEIDYKFSNLDYNSIQEKIENFNIQLANLEEVTIPKQNKKVNKFIIENEESIKNVNETNNKLKNVVTEILVDFENKLDNLSETFLTNDKLDVTNKNYNKKIVEVHNQVERIRKDFTKVDNHFTLSKDQFKDIGDKLNSVTENIFGVEQRIKAERDKQNYKIVEADTKLDKKIEDVESKNDDKLNEITKNVDIFKKDVSADLNVIGEEFDKEIVNTRKQLDRKISDVKIEQNKVDTKLKKLFNEEFKSVSKDLKTTNVKFDKQLNKYKLLEDKTKILMDEVKLVFKDEKLTDIDKKISFLEETLEKFNEKTVLTENLVNVPSETNRDPLTPLNQDYVTFDQLKKHYQMFIGRVQQQLMSLGGGGAVRIDQLDDVNIRDSQGTIKATNGQSLVYITASGKFEPISVGAAAGEVSTVGGAQGAISNAQILQFFTSGVAANVGNLSLSGNIIPDADNVHSLGTESLRFKDLFLSGNTFKLGGLTLKDTGGKLAVTDSADEVILEASESTPGLTSADLTVANIAGYASNLDTRFTGANVGGALTGGTDIEITAGGTLNFTGSGGSGVASIGGYNGTMVNTMISNIVISSGVLKAANISDFTTSARSSFSGGTDIEITGGGAINFTGSGGSGVASIGGYSGTMVNTQISNIVISSGVLRTNNVTEDTNLYFTNDRANAMIASNAIIGGYSLSDGITNPQSNSRVSNIVISSGVLKSANISDLVSTARGSLSKADGAGAYNTGTGVITIPSTTAHISEYTNLFYANGRANSTIVANLNYSNVDYMSNLIGSTTQIQLTSEKNFIRFYAANQSAFPAAGDYHGAIMHSHADAGMYFAHGGAWIKLIDQPTLDAVKIGGYSITSGVTNPQSNSQISNIVISSGVLKSANVTELTNLFFTNARANAMIASNAIIGGYSLSDGITNPQSNSRISNIVVSSGVLKSANISDLVSTARGSLSKADGAGAYNTGTGVITIPATTAHVAESASGLYFSNTRANGTISANVQHSLVRSLTLAASDETTDLTTGTAKVTFRAPFAMTLPATPLPRISVQTAPVGGTPPLIVDINEGGSTILSTKLTIDENETTSKTAATPCVVSDATIADDAIITVDIDQIGSSTAGKGLKLTLYYTVTE